MNGLPGLLFKPPIAVVKLVLVVASGRLRAEIPLLKSLLVGFPVFPFTIAWLTTSAGCLALEPVVMSVLWTLPTPRLLIDSMPYFYVLHPTVMPLATILLIPAESRTPPELQHTTKPSRFRRLVTWFMFRETLLLMVLLETQVQAPRVTYLLKWVVTNCLVTVVFSVTVRFRLRGLEAPLILCVKLVLGRFGAMSFYRCRDRRLLAAQHLVRESAEQSTGDTRFGLRKK